jgi:xanthine dehydrogenase YagT iron-sulfur-binding subunit
MIETAEDIPFQLTELDVDWHARLMFAWRERADDARPSRPGGRMRTEDTDPGLSRRHLIGRAAAVSVGVALTPTLAPAPATATPATVPAAPEPAVDENLVSIVVDVNGQQRDLTIDPRVTLLDALRERLDLTGTKKGCDRGQCGACTVHIDGRRVLSCLTLAATVHRKAVTTVEGLARGRELHPVQQAFIECDGFQCGFCTPGQIMSAVALIREGHAAPGTNDEHIREWMSGNICRCGAYPNIVAAVKQASGRGAG